MKIFRHLILVLASLAVFSSCMKEEEKTVATAIMTDKQSLEFGIEDELAQTLIVYADAPWTVETPSWITVEPAEGPAGETEVLVTASANIREALADRPRSAEITFKGVNMYADAVVTAIKEGNAVISCVSNIDNNVKNVMHNGKFDYEVIKCTCDIELPPNWDTMVAARLLNENEPAALKHQYTTKIDPSQQKYDIEGLFENVFYAQVDPEIFALYAATDSMMTYKLWEYQQPIMNDPDNKNLKWLFEEIEMPIVVVTAEMELVGVTVDVNFGEKLKEKYNKQLDGVDSSIQQVLENLHNIIEDWKLSPDANKKSKQFEPKKSKKSRAEVETTYPLVDAESGLRYKEGKSLSLQLSDPINLASPTQLAILFYDILGCESPDDKNKRGTGEDQLKGIKENLEEKLANLSTQPNYEQLPEYLKASGAKELCSLILDRRGIVKLITTYIDVIPELAKHWPDGRIRFHLNANGTDTGRYSSGGKIKYVEDGVPVTVSGINIQNIPSHNKDIRMLFVARKDENKLEINDNYYELEEISEIETTDGWKYGKDLIIGDKLITSEGFDEIINIEQEDNIFKIYIKEALC